MTKIVVKQLWKTWYLTGLWFKFHSFSHCQGQQGTQMQSEWNKYLLKRGCTGWTVLKPLQTVGERYDVSRCRRSGEQSQSMTKPGRRMGRRPEQRTVQTEWRGMKQASINERFSAPGLVGRLPSGSLRLVEQDWREHTAQTHNKTACKTPQQHYSATQET